MPLVFANVAVEIYNGPPGGHLQDKPPLSSLPQEAGAPHVIWFIFDEWDQVLTFGRRPAHLELPELDRFRNQTFHTDYAYTPGRHTVRSIPSLLTGKTFINEAPKGASELMLTYDQSQAPERLTADSTIFSEARSGGFNVGIVGFHLPYCRMFSATTCEWYTYTGLNPVEFESPLSIGRFMALTAKRQASALPFGWLLGFRRILGEGLEQRSLHEATYRQIHENALQTIVDSRLNLVFVHWSVPHFPIIYDAAKDGFSNEPDNTYKDNLRLVDRTVRDVRLTLEKAGLWDSSTILMTSDHPLRALERSRETLPQTSEVPFLLKMANKSRPMPTTEPYKLSLLKIFSWRS